MCASCGRYRGRVVVDMAAKIEKKQEKAKAKAKARGDLPAGKAGEATEQTEDKVLNAAELSKK